jgi:hypothetical protein
LLGVSNFKNNQKRKRKKKKFLIFFVPVRTAAPRGRPCAFADGGDALTTWRWKDIRAAATVADVCDVTHTQPTESIESKKLPTLFLLLFIFSARPPVSRDKRRTKMTRQKLLLLLSILPCTLHNVYILVVKERYDVEHERYEERERRLVSFECVT